MKSLTQSGSHIVALAVGVLVLGVIGFGGYHVYQANQKTNSDSTSSAAVVPTTIKTKADLTTTSKVLDDSSAQLDSSLDDSALNADLSSML